MWGHLTYWCCSYPTTVLPVLPYPLSYLTPHFFQEYKSKFKWVWDGLEGKNGDQGPTGTLKV